MPGLHRCVLARAAARLPWIVLAIVLGSTTAAVARGDDPFQIYECAISTVKARCAERGASHGIGQGASLQQGPATSSAKTVTRVDS